MLIRKFDPAQLVDAYDVKEQMLYPCSEVASTPFGSAWLVVEPGRRTKPHNHHENETFFILRGRGKMTVGDETRPVEPGDVIYMPPFGDHILENESPHEDLHFLTVWWEDPAALAGLKAGAGSQAGAGRRTVVAAPGPARLDAEIYARFARLCGAAVRLVDDSSGADAGAVRDLFARLQTAGRVVLRPQPAPGLFFDPAPQARAIAQAAGRVAMSPRLRTLADAALGDLRPGLDEVAVSEPAAAPAAAGDLPLTGLEGHRFAARFVRAARLLALAGGSRPGAIGGMGGIDGMGGMGGNGAAAERGAQEGGQTVVFVDPVNREGVHFHLVLVPALADAAAMDYLPEAFVAAGEGAAALADLAAGGAEPVPADWLDWLGSLEARVARHHQGLTPPTQAWTPGQQEFVGRLQRHIEEVAAAYQAPAFAPRRAARLLRELVAAARELAEREEPWSRLSTRREEASTAVAVELLAAKVLAILSWPLVPSARLWHGLGYSSPLGEAGPGAPRDWEQTPTFVPTGQSIRGLATVAATPA